MEEKDLKIYQEERPWGYFRRFTDNVVSTVKVLSVKPNEQLSLQSHKTRSEFWKVVGGDGTFYIDEKEYTVKNGDENFIPVGSRHTMKAGSNGLEILEISLGHYDEDDIIRYQDKYGRI